MGSVVYKKSSDIVVQAMGDEKIIVPLSKNVGDMTSVYTLRNTGLYIWDNIDGKNTIEDLVSLVTTQYDVNAEQAKKDIELFLSQLGNFIVS